MKVIYQGKTKTGKAILIRYPQIGDEKEMWRYINELSKEKTYVRFQGEEVSLKDEIEYLNSQLKKIKDKKVITFLTFYQNELVAISDINMSDKTERHTGALGISVVKDLRGEGVGNVIMDLILKEAKKELPELKIVTLEVYSTNDIAQKMYQKFGFVQYGLLPNGIMRGGSFEDAILMYKNIR